jgi:hypothetical protein
LKRLLVTLVLSLVLVFACDNPLPAPSTPARYHFHAGQSFSGRFHQITTGKADIAPLASEFSAQESFQVVSVDAQGNATINVSLSNFFASTSNSEPVATPSAFQFILDARGQVVNGHVWPLLGVIQLLPLSDQLCIPLPLAPLSGGLTYSASLGHARSETLSATVDTFLVNYPVALSATAHSTFSNSSNTADITTKTTGTLDQRLACHFNPATSLPQDLQSNLAFQFTQTATLGTATQSLTSTGSVNTTVTYGP